MIRVLQVVVLALIIWLVLLPSSLLAWFFMRISCGTDELLRSLRYMWSIDES